MLLYLFYRLVVALYYAPTCFLSYSCLLLLTPNQGLAPPNSASPLPLLTSTELIPCTPSILKYILPVFGLFDKFSKVQLSKFHQPFFRLIIHNYLAIYLQV